MTKLPGVAALRNAVVILPDGSKHRRQRVRITDNELTVEDRRTNRVTFRGDVLDAVTSARQWQVETTTGTVTIRSGCGCG